jgi:hypothetical protein
MLPTVFSYPASLLLLAALYPPSSRSAAFALPHPTHPRPLLLPVSLVCADTDNITRRYDHPLEQAILAMVAIVLMFVAMMVVPLFTEVPGIGILGSSYPRSCIASPRYP